MHVRNIVMSAKTKIVAKLVKMDMFMFHPQNLALKILVVQVNTLMELVTNVKIVRLIVRLALLRHLAKIVMMDII